MLPCRSVCHHFFKSPQPQTQCTVARCPAHMYAQFDIHVQNIYIDYDDAAVSLITLGFHPRC
jgi:hypothetical protein